VIAGQQADQGQARGDGFQFASGLDAINGEPAMEDPPHRGDKGRAAGQEHAIDLACREPGVGGGRSLTARDLVVRRVRRALHQASPPSA
jgi:hypothetical protein